MWSTEKLRELQGSVPSVCAKCVDRPNSLLSFSHHHPAEAERPLLPLPQAVQALLHQGQMPLRGGRADALLCVSEPASQRGVVPSRLGFGKPELTVPSAHTVPPGPALSLLSMPWSKLLMERLTHPSPKHESGSWIHVQAGLSSLSWQEKLILSRVRMLVGSSDPLGGSHGNTFFWLA